MNKFKVGDYVKGNKQSNHYTWTTEKMTRGKVIKICGDSHIRVRILKHTKDKKHIGKEYEVFASEFDLIESTSSTSSTDRHEFKVGDIVRGLSDTRYCVTTTRMTKGEVTRIFNDAMIEVKVLEHKKNDSIGEKFEVESEYFELVERK